jgi:hypothetical protein
MFFLFLHSQSVHFPLEYPDAFPLFPAVEPTGSGTPIGIVFLGPLSKAVDISTFCSDLSYPNGPNLVLPPVEHPVRYIAGVSGNGSRQSSEI